jgi:SAM-dependent methyltransferase
MSLKPHSPAWYDRLAEAQPGYYYPWHSYLPPFHGEDVYQALAKQHLSPTMDVFEAACAYGAFSLEIATQCRSILAYDRIASWIERAQQSADQRGLANVTFVQHDSSAEANAGQVCLPAPDASFDLLLCSKGPFHWLLDARRVARPGAILLMLVPDAAPLTVWHAQLPEALRWNPTPDNWARPAIEQRLAEIGMAIDSWWSFDVPERFADPEQLYRWLTWGWATDEVPTLVAARALLEQIFDRHGQANGIVIRHRRYIWKAVVPD